MIERSRIRIPAGAAGDFSSPGSTFYDMEHGCMDGCMVYTELAQRRQQFHLAPAMPALKYTTSVDIQKRAIKNNNNKTSHSCRITCERRSLQRAENSAI